MNPRQYSEAIAEFNQSAKVHVPKLETDESCLTHVGILGGPLIKKLFRIFDLIEEYGGRVALDGTETGERGLPAPFDASMLERDPLLTLVKSYFLSIPDAFRRPDTPLYEWLGRMIDMDFKADLEAYGKVTPCGEAGEFHTFVIGGPLFTRDIVIKEAEKVLIEDHWFLNIRKAVLD